MEYYEILDNLFTEQFIEVCDKIMLREMKEVGYIFNSHNEPTITPPKYKLLTTYWGHTRKQSVRRLYGEYRNLKMD